LTYFAYFSSFRSQLKQLQLAE